MNTRTRFVDKKDEIPPVVRTKQIEELTEKDYNDWETRDDSRNENIVHAEVTKTLQSIDERIADVVDKLPN